MKVQFIDFSQQYHEIKDEIDKGLKEVFRKADFGENDLSAFNPRFSPILLDNFSFGPV